MILRSLTTLALALALMAPVHSHAQSASADTPGSVAPLSAAAAQLLELRHQRVDDLAVELGERLVREHPDDAALHALYAISLRQHYGWKEALQLSEELVARWPDDPWVQVARAYVLRVRSHREEALEAASRALQLAPDDPDIALYVIHTYLDHVMHEEAIALADSFIASGRATTGLRRAKATALQAMATLPGRPDTVAAALAQRELEIALEQKPPSATVYLAVGERLLRDRRPADALPMLERAAGLSPWSSVMRRAYWRGISAQPDLTTEEKRAMIDADIDAFLEARRYAVGAKLAVADHFMWPADAERFGRMADLIEREHAGTWQAAQIAINRANLSFRTSNEQAETRADSTAAMREFREMLRPVTTMPNANSSVLASAYGAMFWTLEQDSTSTADELLAVFERLEEHSAWPSNSRRHISLPLALAERGSHLDYAEELARGGLEAMEDDLEQWGRMYLTVAEYAEELDRLKSNHHATVGWVLFHRGELAEAKRELEKAHEALDTEPTPPYRLGRIAEAEGDIESAERWYATGRGRENWDRRSSDALKRLYLARNESMDGFDVYLAEIDERDRARRLALVESQRIAEPQLLPAFEHEWMNGGRFSSASLEGKVAVIYFWGVWCGPCVRAAPNTQAFAEKFRDHPDVVFITVANDLDPNTTRDFMQEKGYDFPVILDEGLVRMTNIFAWPTTLFVDRDGRIVFNYVSASPRVLEEYTWRVEALLGDGLVGAGPGQAPADSESQSASDI